MKTHHLTIIGAGAWGTALALLAARNGHEVLMWGHDEKHIADIESAHSNSLSLPGFLFPPNLQVTTNLASAMHHANTFVLAIPSHVFTEVFLSLKPYLNSHHQCIIATKGVEPETGNFLTDVVASNVDFAMPAAVLSGPGFAAEVADNQPSAVTLACLSDSLAQESIQLFHNTYFRIYRTQDLKGVQVGGVVKNVLAIAAGIAEGLGFRINTQAALLTRGLAEMVRLGLALGGKEETFLGLAGVGDLILTATSNQSRNRRFGLLVGQGVDLAEAERQVQQVVEGVHNAAQICQIADRLQIEMPITHAVYQILRKEISPKEAVHALLMREPKREGV